MTTTGGLEGRYRRLLRWYPSAYRGRHEEEILAVLMAAAHPEQRRPDARDSLDLVWSALKIRIRMMVRGAADSEPWAAALAMAGVLLPLLTLVLKLTLSLDRGAQYGFGTPADILIGAYGYNPYPATVTFNMTQLLTTGPLPALTLAVLACLGWRRSAAAVTASMLLAYLGISLSNGYTLLTDPGVAVTLFAYGLETLILLITPGAARGWRALRWRPGVLLATATVAAGVAMNGGFRPLFYHAPPVTASGPAALQRVLASFPHSFISRLFGVGQGEWGDWLLHQGTLVAVIAVAVTAALVSSPVSRRALFLLAVPFALGAVMYLCGLVSPPLPVPVGNTLVCAPLLATLLAAVALRLGRRLRAGTRKSLAP
jgi:hypothetical protein